MPSLATRIGALAALAFTVVAGAPAQAASIVARDVGYLSSYADLIVEARVERVQSAIGPDGRPWTHNQLRVVSYWKGSGPEVIDVEQLGGAYSDGRVLHIDGDLLLKPGMNVVAFLDQDGGHLHSMLLGWSVFEITEGLRVRRHQEDFGLLAPGPDGGLRPVGAGTVSTPSNVLGLRAAVRLALGGK